MDNATLTPNQKCKCKLYYFSIIDILRCIDSWAVDLFLQKIEIIQKNLYTHT